MSSGTACVSPEPTRPTNWNESPPFSGEGDAPLPERWWLAFDDPALNRHIEAALDGSFSLVAAWERLRAAQALAKREGSDLLPRLDGSAGAAYEEDSETGGMQQLSLGLEARYEVDLWREIRARVEAERLRAAASRAEYQTAALSLSAEVTRIWYQLAEAQSQQRLLREQFETNQTVLEVLLKRFAVGQIRSADVLRQRQLVEATREQAVVVRARLQVIEHQFALLKGRPPQAGGGLSDAVLPSLPPMPATGLPGDLVQRRPDVRQAYLLLEAADRDLASAVSARYPRLDLAASFQTAAEKPEDLFNEWIASLAGQLLAPLLDGGRRSSEVERSAAVKREQLAEYGQTVLTAFQEVEDALARERTQQDRVQSLAKQLKLARQTYQQLRIQYLNGVTDYIAVLAALTADQRLQRDLLSARLALVEFRISLYRALAGDFETRREQANEHEDDRRSGHG